MSQHALFKPVSIGAFRPKNRVVMAPLTRMRSSPPGNVPNAMNAEYYGQRATCGSLLVSEATQVSQQGQGYPLTPGIHSDEQVAGWRLVTDAVHAKGAEIVLQLWHVGRQSNHTFQEGGKPAVGPSAIPIGSGQAISATFEQIPQEVPRALETEEIAGVVEDFRLGALRAQRAGFDGVEIHSANGYLLEQFLSANANQREDRYGGSVENRARIVLEIAEAVCSVWPEGRVGIRLSPWGTFNDIQGTVEERHEQYSYLLRQLQERHPALAYAHIVEERAVGSACQESDEQSDLIPKLVEAAGYRGAVIAAGGYTRKSGIHAAETYATAVAYGRLFISNPDLPARLEADAELTPYDRSTFYGGDAKGYIDYPFQKA